MGSEGLRFPVGRGKSLEDGAEQCPSDVSGLALR